MAQEKIEYLVIKLENEEKITAIGLNFKSASGGVNNCFKLELQADILLKGKWLMLILLNFKRYILK